MNKLILIGGGGHCKSCIDVIEQEDRFEIVGIVDLPENISKYILGYPIIASDDNLNELILDYYLVTIGQIKTPEKRINIYNNLKRIGAKSAVVVSPKAYVSTHAEIGEGTIIMHGSIVNANAKIGCNCIINSGAIIEHDAVIGSHCHISTGSIINGGVFIDEGTFIGSRAMIREGVKIGRKSVIGGGIIILKNVSEKSFIKL